MNIQVKGTNRLFQEFCKKVPAVSFRASARKERAETPQSSCDFRVGGRNP